MNRTRQSDRLRRVTHAFFRYFTYAFWTLISGTMAGTIFGAIQYTSGFIACSFMGIVYCLYGLIWGPRRNDHH